MSHKLPCRIQEIDGLSCLVEMGEEQENKKIIINNILKLFIMTPYFDFERDACVSFLKPVLNIVL